MPVSLIQPGETATIQRIGGTDEARQQLAEIGFVVGEDVTMVSNNGGNVILQVKDCRVALDRKMASRVIVA